MANFLEKPIDWTQTYSFSTKSQRVTSVLGILFFSLMLICFVTQEIYRHHGPRALELLVPVLLVFIILYIFNYRRMNTDFEVGKDSLLIKIRSRAGITQREVVYSEIAVLERKDLKLSFEIVLKDGTRYFAARDLDIIFNNLPEQIQIDIQNIRGNYRQRGGHIGIWIFNYLIKDRTGLNFKELGLELNL